MRPCYLLFFSLCITGSYCATGQMINTIAGTGTSGFSGDGGSALAAQLNGPFGVAADAAGYIYIADRLNNRIRKVDAAGNMSTVAGNGTGGYTADGIAATASALFNPTGIATDGAGNLYIADKSNNRIRKVAPSGIITTIAGTGTNGNTGDGGPATNATIANPYGLATDAAGNVYIADQGNNRVRRIDAAGIITAFAGTGTTGFSGDGGAATGATFRNPYAIACDAAGNVFIADVDNQRIRKVSPTGTISTIAGNGTGGYGGDYGPATDAQLYEPIGVAVDATGTIYIADAWNHRIRGVTSVGQITTLAGTGIAGYSGDGGHAASAQFRNPNGVATNPTGDIYVADYSNHAIRRITKPTGLPIAQILSPVVVSPNPNDGNFSLFIQAKIPQSVTLHIYNATGQTVYSTLTTTGAVTAIKLAQPAGTYYYTIATENNRWHGAVVVR
jgi:sugar lactone lactonase YvrE